MSTPTLRFFTVCGHEATVKKCSTRDQWISRIVGPRVTNKSGVKTVYCDENEQAAKERIAKFLKISPSRVVSKSTGIPKKLPKGSSVAKRTPPQRAHAWASNRKQWNNFNSNKPASSRNPSIVAIRSNLRAALRELTINLARTKNVAPRFVMDDKSLDEIVSVLPMNDEELMAISGLGAVKALEYGPMIFEVIRKHREGYYESDSNKQQRVLVHV